MTRECIYGAARDITSNDAIRAVEGALRVGGEAVRAYCFEGIGTIIGGVHPTGGAGGRPVAR